MIFFGALQLQAQTATINNNTNCQMKMIFGGFQTNGCTQCQANTILAIPGTTSHSITAICQLDDLAAVNVQAFGNISQNVTVQTPGCSSGNCGTVTTATGTFWVQAGGCYAVNKQIEVTVTCTGSDLEVDIDEL